MLKAMNKTLYLILLSLSVYYAFTIYQQVDAAEFKVKPFEEIENSSPEKVSCFLEEVYQSALDRGISNYIPYSILLVLECKKALKKKDYEKALIFTDYAEKLSPDFYLPSLASGISKWKANRLSVLEPLLKQIETQQKKILDLQYVAVEVARKTAVLFFSVCAVLLALCGIFLIKYSALLFHDLKHCFPLSLADTPLKVLLAIVIFLPLVFNMSLFWGLLYIMLLLLAYQTKREKIASILVLAMCLILPFFLWCFSFTLHAGQNQLVNSVWNVNYGYWTEEDIEKLNKYLNKYPEDAEVLFSLALVLKKQGRYTRAGSLYNQIKKFHNHDFRVLTNLGNIYYAMGKWDKAVDAYKQAVKANPVSSGAAFFNLSRAYRKMFMFEDAEEAFLKAKELDRKMVDRYIEIYSENLNRLLIDEIVSRQEIVKKAYKMFVAERDYTEKIWSFLFAGISYRTSIMIIWLFVLFGVLITLKDTFRIALRCYMCGKSICKRCEAANSADLLCEQCSSILKGMRKIEPDLKKQKIEEILSYQSFNFLMGRIFCFLLPGAGYVWKGRAIRGTVILMLFFILLANLLAGFYFKHPTGIEGFSSNSAVLINITIIIFLWVLSSMMSLKYKTVGHEELLLKKITAMSKEQ